MNEPWIVNPIPALEPGDRLMSDEFLRRYEAMPNLKQAELIEGIVFIPAPVRFRRHGRPHSHLVAWLGTYEASTSGVEAANSSTCLLDDDNVPQPDGLLLIDPACGGQAVISEDDFVEHAPELVAEVCSSSVSIEMNAKFHVYRRHGVKEYIVWRVIEKQIDWFVLRSGRFEQLAPDVRGRLCSETFPGLWLDAAALIHGMLKEVFNVLKEGIATDEHAAFVAKLVAAKR